MVVIWPMQMTLVMFPRMNAKEGGSQPLMHDTIYNGKHISMAKVEKKPTGGRVSTPRGMMDVFQQRGKDHPKMKVDDM